MLGWQDLRQAYRRSVVGPFWLTLGTGAQIATIGLVFGVIFKVKLEDYFPYLATSIVLWTFISSTVLEGAQALIASESMIRQLKLPVLTYVIRVVWRNLLTLGHNLVILPIVFIIFQVPLTWSVLLILPGILLLVLSLTFISYIAAFASARFRDIPPILNSLLMVAFYLTPVMWQANQIGDALGRFLIGLNPLYHLVQIVRLPLLGLSPTFENWLGASLIFVFGLVVYFLTRSRIQKRIAYWV